MTKSLVSYQELVHNNRTFYLDNLLFGNGFSMHFNSGFSYNNLYEESKNLFNIEDEKMFELFNTRNFELVLKALYTAIKTNYVFDIKDEQVNSSYKRIKSGLIDAVRKVHPQLEELHPNKERQLKWAFMLFKKSIFTTNYDLLPYWALLSRGVQGVSDGFGFDKKSRQIMFGKGAGSSDESPLELYYLHGALHFYMDNGELVKITRDKDTYNDTLLNIITNSYDRGNFPLYVSEGTWEQKLSVIENNKYLMYCYKALQNVSGSLTIYGQSLNKECDMHIINAIKGSKVTNLAYGIYDKENADEIMYEIKTMFTGTQITVDFFDSTNFFQSLEQLQLEMLLENI